MLLHRWQGRRLPTTDAQRRTAGSMPSVITPAGVVSRRTLSHRRVLLCRSSAVQDEVADLAAACGAQLDYVEARPQNNQRGLYATEDVKKDEALFYVPLAVR